MWTTVPPAKSSTSLNNHPSDAHTVADRCVQRLSGENEATYAEFHAFTKSTGDKGGVIIANILETTNAR